MFSMIFVNRAQLQICHPEPNVSFVTLSEGRDATEVEGPAVVFPHRARNWVPHSSVVVRRR